MRGHIDAVTALLAPTGYTVYYVDVPEVPTLPYVLLWSSSGRMVSEAICDARTVLDEQLGVTTVAGTPEGVLTASAVVRARLDDAQPAITGRRAWLALVDSQPVQVDRQTTIPSTNRHPAYGVDLYRYRSVPA